MQTALTFVADVFDTPPMVYAPTLPTTGVMLSMVDIDDGGTRSLQPYPRSVVVALAEYEAGALRSFYTKAAATAEIGQQTVVAFIEDLHGGLASAAAVLIQHAVAALLAAGSLGSRGSGVVDGTAGVC